VSRNILIIGANGFVGTALANRLLADGHVVHRLQKNLIASTGERDYIHTGDLSSADAMRSILVDCDTIFYVASSTTPGSSIKSPTLESEYNLLPLLQLLEVLPEFSQTRLVFLSSGGTVYGNPESDQTSESGLLSPLSYYGAGKLASEVFLKTFHALTGQGVTILRPSNLYGPGQSMRQGFGIIRTMLECARQSKPIDVWGDGEAVRDFLFIDDMVDACCRAVENDGNLWRLFNVGGGIGYSINQVKHMVDALTGTTIPVRYHPERPGDVRRIVLDCSRMHSELGWQAITSLSDGLELTWRWLAKVNQ